MKICLDWQILNYGFTTMASSAFTFIQTGDEAKRAEYEEKKREWENLQKETKGNEETDEKGRQ